MLAMAMFRIPLLYEKNSKRSREHAVSNGNFIFPLNIPDLLRFQPNNDHTQNRTTARRATVPAGGASIQNFAMTLRMK